MNEMIQRFGFPFAVLIILIMSGIQSANAQTPIDYRIDPGRQKCADGYWHVGGCGGYTGGAYYGGTPMMVPQGLVGMPIGQGGGISDCAAIGALTGGTLGSTARSYQAQRTILGAVLGGVIGSMLCRNSAGHQVIVAQPQVGQVAYQQVQSERVVVPSKCDFKSEGLEVYTYDGKAGCDKIAARLSKEVVSEPAQNADQKTNNSRATNLQFSGEGSGEGTCRMKSDGQARLASSFTKVIPRDEVIAVSESTSDSGSARVEPLNSGENCNAWRRRVANNLLWRG